MANGFYDEGKRWFNDKGELCNVWENISGGKEYCAKIWLDGDKIRYFDRSGKQRSAKLVKGNHAGWDSADWK